ncbi:IS3 family transposase [Guptibacillus hwajinpoensis]
MNDRIKTTTDDVDIKSCHALGEVKQVISDYIEYYNTRRY